MEPGRSTGRISPNKGRSTNRNIRNFTKGAGLRATRLFLRPFLPIVTVLTLVVGMAGEAATPNNGAVSLDQPTVGWTGTFNSGGANLGVCFAPTGAGAPANETTPFACDIFSLDVDVAPEFWNDNTGGVTVVIDAFNPPESDLDLYIFRRTPSGGFGSQVGSSASEPGKSEQFTIANASGGYLVLVEAFAATPGTTYRGTASLAGEPILICPGRRRSCPVDSGPLSVVAVIDTGINPYSLAFRDESAFAKVHPARYIANYPKTALPLNLTLSAPRRRDEPWTYEKAVERDAAIWGSVKRGQLYYVPGTRIVGLIGFGAGGTRCAEHDFFPVNTAESIFNCSERILLDDHGHGTMTASRAAGGVLPEVSTEPSIHSLGADAPAIAGAVSGSAARIVMIEGLGAQGVRFASDAGWIDVQSNSWAEILPHPTTALITDVNRAFHHAARRHLVFAASGNGLGGFFGFAPHNTYAASTGAPGVLLVGAHDNGKVALWSGSPSHVVTDGYAGWMGFKDSIEGYAPDSVACCTSAASPYAAGGAVRVISAARQILGSSQVGIRNRIVATHGTGTVPLSGPLSDGVFTLDELKAVLLHTAEAIPQEGRDDGLVQWLGDPRAPDQLDRGPGANPYCNGCQTLPIGWVAVGNAPAYPLVGYGAINERSTDLAIQVLRGLTAEPSRTDVDAFFDLDETIRSLTLLRPDNNPEPSPSPSSP